MTAPPGTGTAATGSPGQPLIPPRFTLPTPGRPPSTARIPLSSPARYQPPYGTSTLTPSRPVVPSLAQPPRAQPTPSYYPPTTPVAPVTPPYAAMRAPVQPPRPQAPSATAAAAPIAVCCGLRIAHMQPLFGSELPDFLFLDTVSYLQLISIS
jgi:hypothetical protein